ncbi:MAG: PIN domain-containing protein [Thaumarchaeota archaeon]|nr:PIN domain-containing protein [Nitrososphaerota archaeon]
MSSIKRLNGVRERLTVVMDTNAIIRIMKHDGPLRRTLRRFKGLSLRILILKIVLAELNKIADYSEEEVVSEISRKLHSKVTVIGQNEDISSAAEELEAKYSSAHYPDSVILATALISDSTLLSYDQGLLDCAKSEGVKTFVPKNKEAFAA